MWLCSGSTHLYEEFRHAQLDGGHSHDGFVLPWSVQEGFHPDQMMLRDTPDIVVIVQTQNLLVGWTHTHTHTHTVLNRKNGTTSYISSAAIWVTNLCERARSHWLFVSGTPPGGESCKLLPWPAWSAEHERLCLLHSSPVDRLDSSFISQVTEFIIIKETTNIQINLHPHTAVQTLCVNTYLNNHIKVCPKQRLCVLDWQLKFSWFCDLVGWLCDPASRLLVHFPLLLGACGEGVVPWQLADGGEQILYHCMISCEFFFLLLKLTFRIFVVQRDIFSVVAVNAFCADVPPHTSMVLSELWQ